MFVPGDQLLNAALEVSPNPVAYGMRKRVAIVTPASPIALLWTVARGWQQASVAHNAKEIQAAKRELHESMPRFALKQQRPSPSHANRREALGAGRPRSVAGGTLSGWASRDSSRLSSSVIGPGRGGRNSGPSPLPAGTARMSQPVNSSIGSCLESEMPRRNTGTLALSGRGRSSQTARQSSDAHEAMKQLLSRPRNSAWRVPHLGQVANSTIRDIPFSKHCLNSDQSCTCRFAVSSSRSRPLASPLPRLASFCFCCSSLRRCCASCR